MTPFEKAFAAARKAGKKTFEHNGKSYTTELRDEKAPKTAPKPAMKPGGQKRTGYQPGAGPKRDRTPPSQDELAKSTGTRGSSAKRTVPPAREAGSPKARGSQKPAKTTKRPNSRTAGLSRIGDVIDSAGVSKMPGAKRITAAAESLGQGVIRGLNAAPRQARGNRTEYAAGDKAKPASKKTSTGSRGRKKEDR